MACRTFHDVNPADAPLYVLSEPIDLFNNREDLDILLSRIASLPAGAPTVEFICLDTTSRVLAGADENSSRDLGLFVKRCDEIRNKTGEHLCLVHHLGKDQTRGARGHSLLKAALDTELTVTRNGNHGVLEASKQRDVPDGGRFGFSHRQKHFSIAAQQTGQRAWFST